MKLKFYYEDSMDLLNALYTFAKVLPEFGVSLELLVGDDGYEEVELSKIEEKV